jgi:hypothetical protein
VQFGFASFFISGLLSDLKIPGDHHTNATQAEKVVNLTQNKRIEKK